MTLMIGTSSYITSTSGVQSTITTAQNLGMNTMRLASRESWLDTGGSTTRAFKRAYTDYILANTNLNVILDINHMYYTTGGKFDVDGGSAWIQQHWSQIKEWCLQVAQMYNGNDRVIIEPLNEYSLSDFWTKCQEILTYLRSNGITNPIVFNKWEQPWTKLNDPLEKDYYSYHFYFNYWSVSGAMSQMNTALSKGLKICNTEVGAHTSGGSSITTALTTELNQFLAQCAALGIGNCLWNTNNNQDFARYVTCGLVIPEISTPTPVYYTLTIQSTPGGITTPEIGSYQIEENYTQVITATPDTGYNFVRWEIDGAQNTNDTITVTMNANHQINAVFEVKPVTPIDLTQLKTEYAVLMAQAAIVKNILDSL